MVFTLRYILGIFLVLISCTLICSSSLKSRHLREIKPPEGTTDTPHSSEYESLKITTLGSVESSKNASSTSEVSKNVEQTTESSMVMINQVFVNNKEQKEIKNIGIKSSLLIDNEILTQARKENARSLDYDISKYISPEFHSKNNVYSAPTSPENNKYINSDFDRKSTTYSSYYNSEITTPKTDSRFQHVEQGIERDLEDVDYFFQSRQTDEPSKTNLDDLIIKTKDNKTKSNLDFVRYENINSDDKINKKSVHKNYESEKGLNINFDSIYNDTKLIDEALKIIKRPTTSKSIKLIPVSRYDKIIKTEGQITVASISKNVYLSKLPRHQNSVISNKIIETINTEENTEQMKLDYLRVLPESYNGNDKGHSINISKRGSIKYQTTQAMPTFSSKFLLTTLRRNQLSNQLPDILSKRVNRTNEQTVQENNIHSIVVPFPEPETVTESTTIQMYEVTDELETSTLPMLGKLLPNTTYKQSDHLKNTRVPEVYYEMTAESTTMSPDSTLFDSTTEEPTTTQIYKELTTMEQILSTEMLEMATENLETTTNGFETTSPFITTSTKMVDEPTTELTTKSYEESTTQEVGTTENSIESLDSSIVGTTTVSVLNYTKEHSSARSFGDVQSTTVVNIETTTLNDVTTKIEDVTTANIIGTTEVGFDETTTQIIIDLKTNITEKVNNIYKGYVDTTEKTNEIIPESIVPDSIINHNDNTTNSVEKAILIATTIASRSSSTTTTTTEKPFDVKDNDISKENNIKLNTTEIDLEDDDDIDDSEYVDLQSRKVHNSPNNIPEEIEIVPIAPVHKEHTTLRPEINKPEHAYPSPEIVTVRSTTENVVTEEEINETTSGSVLLTDINDDDGGNSGTVIAIIISSVGAVCLVVLATIFLIMRRRQKRFNYGQRCTPVSLDAYSMDNVSVQNSVRRKAAMRGSKRSYGNPAFDDPSSITHPLNFHALSRFATNTDDITDEYEEIPQVTAKMNELPDGCDTKNRYANVIPLPETRVFLTTVSDDLTSDYINANYVTGPKGVRGYYIACQAPLQNTVDDFWRMVWEQQSKVILMVTHLFENGMEKCVDYLPPSEVLDCHRLFGDFQVTLKNREVKDKYIISCLQLKNMVSNSWREVTHMWYSGWPEKGVPDEENSLIAFLIEARSYVKPVQNSMDLKTNETLNGSISNGGRNPETSPVIVHCSPGTGRTGTVIACDIAIREFELKRLVDIPRIVYMIRRDRASAVQTKDQYAFIYKVINLYATKLTGGALDSI